MKFHMVCIGLPAFLCKRDKDYSPVLLTPLSVYISLFYQAVNSNGKGSYSNRHDLRYRRHVLRFLLTNRFNNMHIINRNILKFWSNQCFRSEERRVVKHGSSL